MHSLAAWSKPPHPIFAPWFAYSSLPEAEFAAKARPLSASFATDTNLNPLIARAFATNAPASLQEVAEQYGKLLNEADQLWQELLADYAKQASNSIAHAQPTTQN